MSNSDERDYQEEEYNRHIACNEEGTHICGLDSLFEDEWEKAAFDAFNASQDEYDDSDPLLCEADIAGDRVCQWRLDANEVCRNEANHTY